MKIKINIIFPDKVNIKPTYPYIGMHKELNLFVGFSDEETGVVLDPGESKWKIFQEYDSWREHEFIPIDCSVTLTQKI